MLVGSLAFTQDLTQHKNQLESLLKNMSLSPQWDANKNNISFQYENQTYHATFYAKRQVDSDPYTVFLSLQCETGIETDYLTGIYAINHACDDFYTVKGYLDGFDPENVVASQKFPLIASADLLMSNATSLNENTLSWTLKVMKNVSDHMKASTDSGSINEKPKKVTKSESSATIQEEKNEKTVESNFGNEETTLTEKEQKRLERKNRAKNKLNQLMNSL